MQKESKTTANEAPTLLITADDRTGALEAGGACAELGFDVTFAATPTAKADCAVVDLNSRHCERGAAMRRMAVAANHPARFSCHKMDSGLRGNWAFEVAALIATGRRIAVLASFPDAGRRCIDGTVFIEDLAVTDSAFGRDPRNRLRSSRPADYLKAAGCATALGREEVVVLDAGDNAELQAAVRRCREEDRMLVGTTGGIAAYAATLRPPSRPASRPPLPRPALIVCGSLHPLSRQQVALLDCRKAMPDEQLPALAALADGKDVVLTTPDVATTLEDADAEAMATRLATTAWRWLGTSAAPTLVILGGDTAAAILGDRRLRIHGNVDVGVPTASVPEGGPTIVTKGGGIGAPTTLKTLLEGPGDA